MIRTASELRLYLDQDRAALGETRKTPRFFGDEIWKFQIALRKVEYYGACRGLLARLRCSYHRFRYHQLALQLGFSVPANVCGPGLSLAHYGSIVISPVARIGANCRIHSCVSIGVARGGTKAPQIGDDVYIGPGAKLFGDIVIGDNVLIGANAVVTRSFGDNVTIVGVPARVLNVHE